jgi:hypothetical protein
MKEGGKKEGGVGKRKERRKERKKDDCVPSMKASRRGLKLNCSGPGLPGRGAWSVFLGGSITCDTKLSDDVGQVLWGRGGDSS